MDFAIFDILKKMFFLKLKLKPRFQLKWSLLPKTRPTVSYVAKFLALYTCLYLALWVDRDEILPWQDMILCMIDVHWKFTLPKLLYIINIGIVIWSLDWHEDTPVCKGYDER